MGYPVKYLALLSYVNVMFLFSRLILDFETSHDLRVDGFLPATTRSLAYDFRSSITTRSQTVSNFTNHQVLPELVTQNVRLRFRLRNLGLTIRDRRNILSGYESKAVRVTRHVTTVYINRKLCMASPMISSYLTLSDFERSNLRSLRFQSIISRTGAELDHMLLLDTNRSSQGHSDFEALYLVKEQS